MPVTRLLNCYKPPKKFGWRSENISYNSSENSLDVSHASNSVPPEDKIDKDRPMLDDRIKQSEKPEPIMPSEEVPLDFSVKTKAGNYTMANVSEADSVKQPKHPSPSVAFPEMVNGSCREIPSSYNNLGYPNNGHVRSSNDRNSPETDWSQSSIDSTSPMENGFHGRVLKPSPENARARSDNSPNRNSSLLQELLTTQQHPRQDAESGIRSSTPFPQTNGLHGVSGVPLYNGTSPAMMPNRTGYPFYNFMPQPSPAFAFNYANPRAQLMPNYLQLQFGESGFVESHIERKHSKRKFDFLNDPFKSCSVEDLQQNLRSIELVNPYMPTILPISEHLSPGRLSTDQVSTLSPNRSSPESARSAISHNTTNDSNHDASNASTPTTATNSNHSVINGTSNTLQASSSNDSVSSAITEISSDGRKRKTIPDSEKNEAYYARRSKNNEAARKSRETRRKKEEIVKQTCIALDAQCKTQKHQISILVHNLDQVQRQNYTLTAEIDGLKIQNTLLMEKLKQKKCGQCGSTLPNVN